MWTKGKINEGFTSFVQLKDYTAEGVSSAIFCDLDKMKINEDPGKLIT